MRVAVTIALLALSAPALADPASSQAERLVAAALPEDLALVAIDLPERVAAAHTAGGALSIAWKRAPRAGAMSVQAIVTRSDGTHVRGWARIELARVRPVLVAARVLTAGRIVTDGDVAIERRPTAADQGWDIEPRALIGERVLADVAAGKLIDSTIVSEPAPIARGTELRVFVRRGRVEVSSSGVLQTATRPGEVARVRLGGRRMVSARVVDSKSARIVEGDSR